MKLSVLFIFVSVIFSHSLFGQTCQDTMLIKAIKKNNLEKVKSVLPLMNINRVDCHGETPLMVAAELGYVEIVKFLIEKKADVKLLDGQDRDVLYKVIEQHFLSNKFQLVELLIKSGVDLNNPNVLERPLSQLLKQQESNFDIEIFKLIVRNWADINFRDKNHKTPLMLAIEKKRIDVIDFLLSLQTLNINSEYYGDMTALGLAIKLKDFDLITKLVKHGANVFSHLLRPENIDLEVMKLLIKLDPENLEIVDSGDGRTPLMKAIRAGSLELVKLLVEGGANIEHNNPFLFSLMEREEAISFYLAVKGADYSKKTYDGETSLMYASIMKDSSLFNFLLEKGVDIHEKDRGGLTALFYALNKGNDQAISLLKLGAMPYNMYDGKFDWYNGWSYSYYQNYEKSKEIHLAFKAYVNDQKQNHLTMAILKGWTGAIKPLVEYGIDINSQDIAKKTALIHAVHQENIEALKILVELGADKALKDYQNMTALDYANELGNHELINLLK